MTVWKLHTGRNGDGGLLEPWHRLGIVTVGFSADEPVSELATSELVALFDRRGHRGWGQQIATFRDDIEVGDLIAAPARQRGICSLAIVMGDYQWAAQPMAGNHQHFRAVRWVGDVALDELPEDVDRALQHRWTLTRMPAPAAEYFQMRVTQLSGVTAPRASASPSRGEPDVVWDTPVGTLMTREERVQRYGGATQGGIEPSTTSPNIFVYSDPARGEAYGYNFDGWNHDRTVFFYTGHGREGDQLMKGRNRSLLDHVAARRSLRLFVARDVIAGTNTKLHEYIGEFVVDPNEPNVTEEAPDENGEARTVFVFRLLPVGEVAQLDRDFSSTPDDHTPSAELVAVEAANVEQFAVGATERTTAERREAALVSRYDAYLNQAGHRTARWRIAIPGQLHKLVSDVYDETANELYEAKGTATRDAVRLAIGQLLDYRRHVGRSPGLAVLLPHRPAADLVDFITSLGMACVYETTDRNFARIEPVGAAPE